MPELPEVETTKRGLEPLIVNRRILSAHIYKKKLRWEIPSHLIDTLKHKTINNTRVINTEAVLFLIFLLIETTNGLIR